MTRKRHTRRRKKAPTQRELRERRAARRRRGFSRAMTNFIGYLLLSGLVVVALWLVLSLS
jgi:cell division septal protein FtsQ